MTHRAIEASTATTVTSGGRERLSFAGCGYLGLGHHEKVVAAARRVLDSSGLSTAASRTTSGTHVEHERLEEELARFLHVEATVLAPDGYVADVVAADAIRRFTRTFTTALLRRDAHPSLIDAARACGMEVQRFEGDPTFFDRGGPVAFFVEGVYPMEGRFEPLPEILSALRGSPDSILLDDCHGFGVVGATGRGTLEHFGIADERIVVTASLAKSLGCAGGFVAGTAARMKKVREGAAWIGTTPIPPALAAAARTALAVLVREPERVERLGRLSQRLREMCVALGFSSTRFRHPVRALRFDSEEEGQRIERGLWDRGIHVPYVHYLDDRGALRVAVNAEHSFEDVDRLQEALAALR